MNILRKIITLFLIFLTFTNPLHANSKQERAYRNFWHPFYRGQRLDYCMPGGTVCGLPVANAYCKAMGYAYATQAIKAPNIGITRYIGARLACKGWRCNGFMNIGCAKYLPHSPPKSYYYSKKRFVYPRFNHYRLAWCYNTNRGCGKAAANSFCLRMGYTGAERFTKEKCVPATATIGNQTLCFGKECEGFKEIICYR